MYSLVPSRDASRRLLDTHTTDPYLKLHAKMVAAAMEGYAGHFNEDADLWWTTGFLHDLDYQEHPTLHPGPSLTWLKDAGYPEDMLHAIEAHALGFNGFTVEPQSLLAKTLLACDEICGIFYAYQRLHPIAFADMKVSSIKKRLAETKFAPGIDRTHITTAIDRLAPLTLDDHIAHLIHLLARCDT